MKQKPAAVPRRRRPTKMSGQATSSLGDQTFSKAIGRALDVLESFPDEDTCLGLKEMSQRNGLPESSLFRILQTLEARGYLAQAADGTYRLTPRLLHGKVRERADRVRDIAKPHLQALAMRFNETASLAYLFDDRIQVLDSVETFHAMRLTNLPGRVLPPHCSSMGKSITAFQTPEKINRILEVYGLIKRTPKTLTDRPAILAEFERVRTQGYAFDREEAAEGGICIGAPIHAGDRRVVSAISLSTPLIRFDPKLETAIVQGILDTASAIGHALDAA